MIEKYNFCAHDLQKLKVHQRVSGVVERSRHNLPDLQYSTISFFECDWYIRQSYFLYTLSQWQVTFERDKIGDARGSWLRIDASRSLAKSDVSCSEISKKAWIRLQLMKHSERPISDFSTFFARS